MLFFGEWNFLAPLSRKTPVAQMPPTAVADKTLREKAPGKGGKVPPDLVVFVAVTVILTFFSPTENLPGPLPALISLDSSSFLRLHSRTKRQLFSTCNLGEPSFGT